jgi:hypothetical protein
MCRHQNMQHSNGQHKEMKFPSENFVLFGETRTLSVTLLNAVVSYRSETLSWNLAKNTDSQCDIALRNERGLRET